MRMDRVIAAVAAAVFASGATLASAQGLQPERKAFTGGILAGVNLSKPGGSDVSNASNRTGFTGGLFGVANMAGAFGIELDALYSQKGGKVSGGGTTFTLMEDYIEVPLLLRFDFRPASGGVTPFVGAGPSVAFSVRCRAKVESGGVSAETSCSNAGFDEKKVDFGAAGTAGLGFPMGGSTLSVGVRYTHGFTDIEQTSNAKNRVWSFLVGLSW